MTVPDDLPTDPTDPRLRKTELIGLDVFEAHVMAEEAPALVMVDRDTMRLLMKYVRELEREARHAAQRWQSDVAG
jgi:hypothetical protein